MLEIILLVIGIVKALRRRALCKLTVGSFPGVDPSAFTQWQRAQLRATDAFLWATWGALVIKLVLLAVFGPVVSGSEEGAIAFTVLILGGWIAGLVIAARRARTATKLRNALSIQW